MATALEIQDKEWELALKVKTNTELFIFLTRPFVMKESIPAKKMEKVEWIVKA